MRIRVKGISSVLVSFTVYERDFILATKPANQRLTFSEVLAVLYENSPESFPGSVTGSDQDGLIEKFVHARNELCNTAKESIYYKMDAETIL